MQNTKGPRSPDPSADAERNPADPDQRSPAPYLDAEQIATLLPPSQALRAIQSFYAAHPRETVTVPQRIHLPVPSGQTLGLYMPAATRQYVGVKLVHLMPHRFPSVQAEVFLYDAESGALLFWGDGKPLTALRTAAVSAAAALRLRPRCRKLVVYGAGVQAAAHITAFTDAYPGLETVWVVARSVASFSRLEAGLAPELRDRIQLSERPPFHLAEADCVIATTPAPAPLFEWREVSPDTLIVGVGSATAEMNELPPEAFLEGAVWVDTANALLESGDLIRAKRQGWSEQQLTGDLFDLLTPQQDPRTDAAQASRGRSVFKSVGHAAQDLAILIHLRERLLALSGG